LGIIAVALNAGVLLLFMVHLSPQLQAGPLGHLLCDFLAVEAMLGRV
jgi:hypothetical protein